MEVIPYTLAENAALNPIEVVTELRKRHNAGEKNTGINVRKAGVSDMAKEEVFQPLLVSTSMLTLATETVRSILKIDDIVNVMGWDDYIKEYRASLLISPLWNLYKTTKPKALSKRYPNLDYQRFFVIRPITPYYIHTPTRLHSNRVQTVLKRQTDTCMLREILTLLYPVFYNTNVTSYHKYKLFLINVSFYFI